MKEESLIKLFGISPILKISEVMKYKKKVYSHFPAESLSRKQLFLNFETYVLFFIIDISLFFSLSY